MFIEHILNETGGSRIKAAERLGIHKATLFRKLKSLGINNR
jgi:DNA-binding NtrC family response regulator